MPKLAKIIEYRDTAGDVLAMRMPATGEGVIEWGSQLIVREGQVAMFFRDGKCMARFDPGRYLLTTQEIPLLTKFITGFAYGKGNTPFRAEVYYVGTNLFRDLKWGTPQPVYIPDPALMQIPVRANGRFAIRITDPTIFIPKVVGTRSQLKTKGIQDFLRAQYIVSALTDAVASLGKPFLELPRFYRELGIGVKSLLSGEFGTIGLELTELSVNTVATTEQIAEVLNRNAQIVSEASAKAAGLEAELLAKAAGAKAMSDAGTSYQQVGMADAMVAMGETGGGGGGGGGQSPMDTGVNLGLAMMMPQMMSGMMQGQGQAGVTPVASAPPPTEEIDPIARIKQLKELLDIDAISKEEFDAKKAELMKRI